MRLNYRLLEQVFSYLSLLEVRKACLWVRPCLDGGGGCGWEVTLAGCLCWCNYRSYPRQSVNNPLWCGLVAILTLFVSFKYIYLAVSTKNSTLCKNHPTSPHSPPTATARQPGTQEAVSQLAGRDKRQSAGHRTHCSVHCRCSRDGEQSAGTSHHRDTSAHCKCRISTGLSVIWDNWPNYVYYIYCIV